MKFCINGENLIRLLYLSAKLFKFKIQKFSQILCAHKPYFLMPGHIYNSILVSQSWPATFQVTIALNEEYLD